MNAKGDGVGRWVEPHAARPPITKTLINDWNSGNIKGVQDSIVPGQKYELRSGRCVFGSVRTHPVVHESKPVQAHGTRAKHKGCEAEEATKRANHP